MKYLIVEDERFAYEELKRMMTELRPDYSLEKRTKTVIDTIAFLKTSAVDLILLDIRLADGNCFEIFNHVEVSTPVIFTTAYDEHAIKAFKLNSIDYLLKPFDEKELEAALTKFENIFHNNSHKTDPKNFEQLLATKNKNRFLISKGDNYHYIETADIAHFYSEEGVVFLHTFHNKRYIINYTLDQLEQQLDSRMFFRVSRNCIGNVKSIENVAKYFNSRLKLSFQPACPHEVLVSRVRVPDFLKWMDGILE
ncbi:LytR/AlgR family response regulator transcription factor [Bacteroides reticulotermitis]|uniref:Two-component system response regulator n=2 Tax=Bacteroides reticulotermitis TaxID=1133319 RepID=W4V1F5_9BACE|nr:LytTR family DNA-binding domain-containing protein [Bacteroides reticulotermitis]MBB4046404.1 DNA-binding LytR/AlgR family response regulator [Bacteroides reticulotermitis]GAE86574.1 two-component system response regulator [Bacteroides reticulotermitis JCM 10512]